MKVLFGVCAIENILFWGNFEEIEVPSYVTLISFVEKIKQYNVTNDMPSQQT